MNRLARTLTVAAGLSLALLLSNCGTFDPTDIMDNIFASQKKPLPGDRKPLFPSGTPGVSQGLPPELVKGYQPPPPGEATQDAQAAPDRPKPKPKPKVVAAPPANRANAPTAAATTTPASNRPATSPSSPWPDPPPTRQSAGPSNTGQTAWPDPPAPNTVTR
jgi:hypothetical protein